MCTAAASWSRAAKAAQTQESMPPLRRTTARDGFEVGIKKTVDGCLLILDCRNERLQSTSLFFGFQSEISRSLDSFHRRIPDEFVQLQAKPGGNVVGQHPFSQFLGIEQTVRAVAGTRRVLAECRREQDCVDPPLETVPQRELPGKLVVHAATQDKLDFIVSRQVFQVLHGKRAALSGVRTLHIDDLDDRGRNALERTLPAGLEKHLVVVVQKMLH